MPPDCATKQKTSTLPVGDLFRGVVWEERKLSSILTRNFSLMCKMYQDLAASFHERVEKNPLRVTRYLFVIRCSLCVLFLLHCLLSIVP